ncbi:MAG: hypothetical protein ACT4O1_16290 [Gemmatimonadota bacterium]
MPLPVRRALRKLGADIRDARKRRRIPLELIAQRAMTSHVTMIKVERGDASVSIGVYANTLFALGLVERLGMIADKAHDQVGQALEDERLPQRARRRSPRKASADE